MRDTAEYAWQALKECFENNIKPYYNEVEFDTTKEKQFVDDFEYHYNKVKFSYMTKETEVLDRHKQAAILICCVIENDILTSKLIPKGKKFVGKYSLALSLGLSFMCDRLNERLEEKNINDRITELTDVEPFACPTKYFDVIYRNLYFEDEDMGSVFVLSLANTLFLLEYVALLKKNIDMNLLKEY